MSSGPKIAVLICGHLRTWDKCRDNFIKSMGDADYDVFVHTYTKVKSYHPYIRDTYKVQNDDLMNSTDEIQTSIGIPCKRIEIEDESNAMTEVKEVEKKDLQCYQWSNYDPYHDLQVLKGKGISIRTYFQYRKIRLCNELRKEYERSANIKYDYVFKIRPDLNFESISAPINLILNNIKGQKGVVWISPAGCQPSDRVYLCESNDMDRLINGLGSAVLPTDREYNPHEYLAIAVSQSGLRFGHIREMHSLNPIIG